jgi:hypothetical protein
MLSQPAPDPEWLSGRQDQADWRRLPCLKYAVLS